MRLERRCCGIIDSQLIDSSMATFGEFQRYIRAHLMWLWPTVDRIVDGFRYRSVKLACAAAFVSAGALLVPGLANVLLGGLLAMVVWAAGAPVPHEPTSRRQSRTSDSGSVEPPDGPRKTSTATSVVQALGDPTLTLNRHLEVLEANVAAGHVFGDIRLGQHISHTTRNPALTAAVADAVRSQQRKIFALEIRTPLERHLEGVAAPLNHEQTGGGEAAVLVYLRDLTEQDRLAAMRADFVANASHELRTPLASLKGFIETLQGPARSDLAAQSRFLDIMSQQADRMTRLIDDLLSLSRIEMRVHIPPNAIVNLNEVATSVVAALEPQARLAGTVVAVQPLAGDARVRGDHDELVQAIQNLVQNAIKYGRTHGHIDVRIAVTENGQRALSVTDNGPGIAPEHLPRLTERFYRVNAASSRDRGGTGLGLAIVKHIVTRHRGALAITSTVGRGSTFTISLPAIN